MAWSTREIAQLAGTTVRAVRYYHQVGLLEEPLRCRNGDEQYGVTHLLLTVRIRRLTEQGFSLEQVAGMGQDDECPHDALRHVGTALVPEQARLPPRTDSCACSRTRPPAGTPLPYSPPYDGTGQGA